MQYNEEYVIPESMMDIDFLLPIGKAKTMRVGTDVTLVSYSRGVKYCLDAAELLQKEGISCEVINLRTIRPMDR